MTRIIGLLSWWDESPTWLAATVASMARFCDHVVALDGRYETYPDNRLQSGSAEVLAIIDTARAAGIGVTLHTAPRTFADEMDKRTHLFRLGALEARAHHDWFYVLDGDEVVVESPLRGAVHAFLDHARANDQYVVTNTLLERVDPHETPQHTDLSMKLALDWRYECATPRFWRVLDNTRVVGYHYNYIGENEAGETIEMWGEDTVVTDRAGWASLCGRMVIENRNRMRAKLRDQDRQQYYANRDAIGLETVAPLNTLEGTRHAEA